jgi:hypothetical protein
MSMGNQKQRIEDALQAQDLSGLSDDDHYYLTIEHPQEDKKVITAYASLYDGTTTPNEHMTRILARNSIEQGNLDLFQVFVEKAPGTIKNARFLHENSYFLPREVLKKLKCCDKFRHTAFTLACEQYFLGSKKTLQTKDQYLKIAQVALEKVSKPGENTPFLMIKLPQSLAPQNKCWIEKRVSFLQVLMIAVAQFNDNDINLSNIKAMQTLSLIETIATLPNAIGLRVLMHDLTHLSVLCDRFTRDLWKDLAKWPLSFHAKRYQDLIEFILSLNRPRDVHIAHNRLIEELVIQMAEQRFPADEKRRVQEIVEKLNVHTARGDYDILRHLSPSDASLETNKGTNRCITRMINCGALLDFLTHDFSTRPKNESGHIIFSELQLTQLAFLIQFDYRRLLSEIRDNNLTRENLEEHVQAYTNLLKRYNINLRPHAFAYVDILKTVHIDELIHFHQALAKSYGEPYLALDSSLIVHYDTFPPWFEPLLSGTVDRIINTNLTQGHLDQLIKLTTPQEKDQPQKTIVLWSILYLGKPLFAHVQDEQIRARIACTLLSLDQHIIYSDPRLVQFKNYITNDMASYQSLSASGFTDFKALMQFHALECGHKCDIPIPENKTFVVAESYWQALGNLAHDSQALINARLVFLLKHIAIDSGVDHPINSYMLQLSIDTVCAALNATMQKLQPAELCYFSRELWDKVLSHAPDIFLCCFNHVLNHNEHNEEHTLNFLTSLPACAVTRCVIGDTIPANLIRDLARINPVYLVQSLNVTAEQTRFSKTHFDQVLFTSCQHLTPLHATQLSRDTWQAAFRFDKTVFSNALMQLIEKIQDEKTAWHVISTLEIIGEEIIIQASSEQTAFSLLVFIILKFADTLEETAFNQAIPSYLIIDTLTNSDFTAVRVNLFFNALSKQSGQPIDTESFLHLVQKIIGQRRVLLDFFSEHYEAKDTLKRQLNKWNCPQVAIKMDALPMQTSFNPYFQPAAKPKNTTRPRQKHANTLSIQQQLQMLANKTGESAYLVVGQKAYQAQPGAQPDHSQLTPARNHAKRTLSGLFKPHKSITCAGAPKRMFKRQ